MTTRGILPLFVFVALATPQLYGDVLVSFDKPNPTFTTGQMFSINLLADIPDPVLGYGLDVRFNSSLLSLTGVVAGPSWFAAPGSEPDDVAGLAFPTPVSGSGVLLATLNFTALTNGSDTLVAMFNPSNLAEGFPLVTGGFANSNLVIEPTVGVIPEPSVSGAAVLLSLGALLAGRYSSAKRRTRSVG